MGKGSSSPPPAPDPAATAQAQSGLNAETARLQALLNRQTQVTPYGTLSWSRPQATTGALATGQPQAGQMTAQPFTGPLPASRPAAPPDMSGFTDEYGVFHQGTPAAPGAPTPAAPTQGKPPPGAGAAAGNSAYDPNDVWQQTITLSPEGQKIFDMQNQLAASLSGLALKNFGNVEAAQAQPFSMAGLGDAPQFSLDGMGAMPVADDAARQRVEQAMFDRARAQLDPVYDQRERQLLTRLANQGIPIGSDAYTRATGDFARERDSAYDQALTSAIMGGGQEQSRLFDMGMMGRRQGVSERQQQYSNDVTSRQNAINEMLMQRNQPINELAALMGTSPGVQMPQFTPPGAVGVAPTDITGPTMAQYQSQLAGYNQQQAQNQGLMGGLFGLGGSLGSAAILKGAGTAAGGGLGGLGWLAAVSSKRFKENGRDPGDVLDKIKGLPVERWNYRFTPGDHIGPYAEDFREAFGVGDGTTIFVPDMTGVLLKAVQELTAKVERLEAERG